MKGVEKKYLIKELPNNYDKYEKIQINEIYIYVSEVCNIRVKKILDDRGNYKYFHIIKINYQDKLTFRNEFETEISEKIYNELIKYENICEITKMRYLYPLDGSLKAKIDVYKDDLEGLILTELEFSSLYEFDFFTEPDWFLEDVTKNEKYNINNLFLNERVYKKMLKNNGGN